MKKMIAPSDSRYVLSRYVSDHALSTDAGFRIVKKKQEKKKKDEEVNEV